MATLASDLIESTRRHLFTGQPEKLNKLSAAITSSQTSFAFTYDIAGIQAGSIIAVDLEEIFVFAVDSVSKSVTDCSRGFNGSVAASHLSGAIVASQPKFSRFRILQAINDDLLDLSSPSNGLYQIKTVDITFNPVTYGYNLTGTTDIISIAEVRYRTTGPEKSWPQIESYALLRNMPTSGTFADFASGNALVIYEGAQPGYPIRVRYKAPFVTMANLTDDAQTVAGLSSTMLDIPPLGAAIRLVAGREVKRNFDESQGEPRRAEEVPPQAAMASARELARIRQQRIMAEAARLISTYGYEMVG